MSQKLEEFNTSLGEGLTIKGKSINEIKNIQRESNSIYEEETKTWEKEEAEEWLEENGFKISDYDNMKNFHAFRQNDPDKYDEIRADITPFDFDEKDGVQALYGFFDDDSKGSEIQSIRFYHGGNVD